MTLHVCFTEEISCTNQYVVFLLITQHIATRHVDNNHSYCGLYQGDV